MIDYHECAARIKALRNMEGIKVPFQSISKDTAYKIYMGIKECKNKHTGQTTLFVRKSFDKIIGHKGFDKRIITILANAYENAIYMYNEPVDTLHKAHTNFIDYSHYAVKLLIDGMPVYARYTLENLKVKPGKPKISQFHSIHLSYEVKNNAAVPCVNSAIITTATWGANGTTDLKLQHWLNIVKQ